MCGGAGRYAERDGETGAREGGCAAVGARPRALVAKGRLSPNERCYSIQGRRGGEMASPAVWMEGSAVRRGKIESPRGEGWHADFWFVVTILG